MFTSLRRASLGSNNQTSGLRRKQPKDSLASQNLGLPIENMEEHVNADHIPCALRLDQSTFWHGIKEVCRDEAALKSLLIAEKVMTNMFVLAKNVGTEKVVEWRTIIDKLAQILPDTSTQIEEFRG